MCFYSYWLEAAHHCPKVEEGLLCMSLYIILYISCISCLNLWKASWKSDVFSCPHAVYCTAPNVFLRIGSKSLSSPTKKKTKHWMTRIESALVINFTDLWSLGQIVCVKPTGADSVPSFPVYLHVNNMFHGGICVCIVCILVLLHHCTRTNIWS